jgi:nitroimidazol reductase NimA-like FMN-containing flavoprotein (pyridoxamine 5'-phosphate oxidase superfamily)
MTEPMMKDSWWAIWHRGGRLEELDPAECRRLLAATSIGRLGYQTDSGPRIVPVNYALAGETIAIRTAPRTEIARVASGQTVAFETDQVDEFLQTGWSVLAVGVLNEISAEALRQLAPGQTPDPWAEGPRSVFLQLGISDLTGRRVHPA